MPMHADGGRAAAPRQVRGSSRHRRRTRLAFLLLATAVSLVPTLSAGGDHPTAGRAVRGHGLSIVTVAPDAGGGVRPTAAATTRAPAGHGQPPPAAAPACTVGPKLV